MPAFSLVVEYLTGYAVATDAANRERAEWPPHPARVFMALAAAHFETDGPPEGKRNERNALEWLAGLEPPDMTIPQHTLREVLTVYVPVNDQGSAEALVKRSRQPRLFPRVHVGDELLRLTWRFEDDHDGAHLDALEAVCRNVTRIGHSSSLTWVRLERIVTVPPTHVPDEHCMERGLRIVQEGVVGRLEKLFNRDQVEAYAALEQQWDVAKGAAKKQLKARMEIEFPDGKPTSQRPAISLSRGYREATPSTPTDAVSRFDPNFIVLSESENSNQTFGLESTAQITNALRNVIMKKSGTQPVPAWVSGHETNGEKLESSSHMAIVPLAFVGSNYADGHLMGLGILIPNSVPFRERASVLSKVLFEGINESKPITLTLGNAGEWIIERETSFSPKPNLQPLTYTMAAASWASVTPVVLDRMPKTDRVKFPVEWREEVAGIIALSCKNVGLPEPIAVRVEKTPYFKGSLRAMPGQGGFPQLRKGTFQVHVHIEFDRPVAGPIMIGAGRFRGYGLLRPWNSEVGR